MTIFKVFLIDSNLPLRSNPLILELGKCQRFELFRINASMFRTFDDPNLHNIDFKDVEFRKIAGRSFLPGEIGCANSHNLARQRVSFEDKGALILEDDARILDSQKLSQLIDLFKSTINDDYAILSLTDFLTAGRSYSDLDLSETQFIKLRGVPPLAVAYYLGPKAARLLADANIPIKFVADWPKSEVNFYVSNASFVVHGDSETTSTIEADGGGQRSAQVRTRYGLVRYVVLFVLPHLVRGGFRVFLERVMKSINFRLDNRTVNRKFGRLL
jgi:GR25 family glycosyltransferase involved in LPS biosynthesis